MGILDAPPPPPAPPIAAPEKVDPLEVWKVALRDQKTTPALWVSLGSSTANGGNVTTEPRRWFNRVAALLGPRAVAALGAAAPANGVQFYNAAVGGYTSVTYITDARRDQILALNPHLVTHMVGSNDQYFGTDPATYKDNIRKRVVEIRNGSRAAQLLIHQQPRLDVATPAYPWKAYGEALREIAAEFPDDVAFLNLGEKFEAMGFANPYSGLYDTDNIHLKDEGNKILAGMIGDAVGVPPVYLGRVVVPAGPLAGGSMAQSASYATITVPARPYLQRVIITASIFSGADSGAPDWIISSVSGQESGATSSVSVRVGIRQTYAAVFTDVVAPHVPGVFKIAASLNSGALYMTPSAGYQSIVADAYPL